MPTPTELSLESLKSDFEQWRRDPQRSRCIPQRLWDAIFNLFPTYPKTRIIRTLGISHKQFMTQLQQRQAQDNTSSEPPQNPIEFATVAVTPVHAPSIHHLKLTFANGTVMQIDNVTQPELLPIIQHFTSA